MKIAIHNPFIEAGETSVSISTIFAGKKLGHDIRMFHYVRDIDNFNPDFVIACNHDLPKLTKFPTYGYICGMMGIYDNPTSNKNILSWDGYITSSSRIHRNI